MRVVVQRVSSASVEISGRVKGKIGRGIVVLAGFAADDTEEDLRWIARKLPVLRIFEDEAGKMNLGLREIGGEILLVSQFTLFGNVRKGTRPSYNRAAPPEVARGLYERAVAMVEEELGKPVQTGEFGAEMALALVNDGPVTILMDTEER